MKKHIFLFIMLLNVGTSLKGYTVMNNYAYSANNYGFNSANNYGFNYEGSYNTCERYQPTDTSYTAMDLGDITYIHGSNGYSSTVMNWGDGYSTGWDNQGNSFNINSW